MLRRIIVLVVVAAGFAAGFAAVSRGDWNQFVDGSWELRVDRTLPPGTTVDCPSIRLPEESYTHLSDGPTYSIHVSAEGSHIVIGATSKSKSTKTVALKGSRASSGGSVTYDLQEGTFAGGRFTVWPDETGLQGELTIYGSGVPIISSERGAVHRNK